MTSPDYGTTDEANPNDPDPGAPGPGASADTPGRPAGSAEPIGGTDFVDGAEVSDDSDDGDLETPVVPASTFDEAGTED